MEPYMSPFLLAAVGVIVWLFNKIYSVLDDLFTGISNIQKLNYLMLRLKDNLFCYKARKVYRLYFDYFKTIYDRNNANTYAIFTVANLAKNNQLDEKYRLIEEFKI